MRRLNIGYGSHFARAVWFASPLGVGRGDIGGESVKDWLQRVVESKGVDFDVVLMLLWPLWTERNKLVWKGKVAQPLGVLQDDGLAPGIPGGQSQPLSCQGIAATRVDGT